MKWDEVKSICEVASNGCFKESAVCLSEPGEVNLPSKCEKITGQCLVPI